MPNEIPVVFHSGSNFDCHREHTEKYKTFSIPVEKEIWKIGKDGITTENITIVTYKMKFDSARFVVSSLSNLVRNS